MEFLLIIIVLIGSLFGLYFFIKKQIKSNSEERNKDIESKLDAFYQALKDENHKNLKDHLTDTKNDQSKITRTFGEQIKNVTKSLTEIDKTNKQILDYQGKLEDLQNIFSNPKQRGIWGEDQLEHILSNCLNPDLFEMQYRFHDGHQVDAIVRIGNHIVPIDAKFPLENYNKFLEAHKDNDEILIKKYEKAFKEDLKKRIDETSKYIKMTEGTLNFAYMFIPAEGLYYDIQNSKVGVQINERGMMDYAREKNVSIISPNTIYPFIQIVIQNSQQLQFNENIDKIKKDFLNFAKHMKSYTDLHIKLGKSLNSTVNHYKSTNTKYKQINKDVKQITSNEVTLIDQDQQLEDVENPDLE